MKRLWAFLALLVLLGAGIALHRHWLNPSWDPSMPLDVQAQRTPVTRLKLTLLNHDPALCAAALATIHPAPHPAEGYDHGPCPLADPVVINAMPIPTNPVHFVAACPLAVSWALFEQDATALAQSHYSSPIARIDQLGSYACRDVRREPGRLSAHARAMAIDVSGLVLADGRHISVTQWRQNSTDAAFLHTLRDRACTDFGVVLSPDYDDLHASHLHLQASGGGLCR